MNEKTANKLDATTREVLDRNVVLTHYRLLQALVIVVALIFVMAACLKAVHLTTPALTNWTMIRTFIISLVLLAFLWAAIRRYETAPLTKWVVVTTVCVQMINFITCSNDAPESLSLFYLAILISVFYYDLKLVAYCTCLCFLAAVILVWVYPSLLPVGEPLIGYMIIRYFNFVWFGLAAAIAIKTTEGLIGITRDVVSTNEILKADIERHNKHERMRKEFVASVSHELKSPISLIEGYAEGLRDGVVEGQKRDYYLRTIIDEARTMDLLVTNMLRLSQLEAGTMTMNVRELSLNRLLEHTLRKYGYLFKEKSLIVDLVMPDEELVVRADPIGIEHVVSNFITNAVRYTPEGGRVVLAAYDLNDRVRVCVENEGEHISEDDMDKLWDAFYRVEKSRSREYGGTGLGLAVASSILRLHGSEYGVENIPGGVRFFFYLGKTAEMTRAMVQDNNGQTHHYFNNKIY